LKRLTGHPVRLVPLGFVAAILVGTLLLMLPIAREGPGAAPFLTALFTSTSAVSVTGLAVVDTATYWSGFGRVVILALIQVGGFGIMSSAALLGLIVARRLRLSTRLVAQAETGVVALGDIGVVLRLVIVTTLAVQAVVAAALTLRLALGHGLPWPDAAWHGLFQAVSAFNNAGFSTWSDSLVSFVGDGLVLLPISCAVVLGGLGIPVLFDLWRDPRRPARWTLHTKLTLLGLAILLPGGAAAILAFEWANPATLGAMSWPTRVMNALVHSVMLRTAGFNTVDVGQMRDETLALSWALMLIGGGSAGTAGGIKVTTFLILGLLVWAVLRGESDASAFGRRVAPETQRQAIAVVLLAVGVLGLGVLALIGVTDFPLRDAVFEAVSAFATVGLSTGITPQLPPAGQAVVVALMFIGRVGVVTIGAALALRAHKAHFRYPEERPVVG
jgi:trk system potassium uptake protein TrkH